MAALVVANDGKPLTPEERSAEQARLDRLVSQPDELRRKRMQEKADTDRTLRIMRALPDAFLYEYAGEENGLPGIGHIGDPLVKLTFRPNPSYRPPSRVEEVLTGMQGVILLDAVHYRIASIDGTLFKPVSFGWGILGHLNAGGHFLVHQQEVDDDDWEISSMALSFMGKVLLLKSLNLQSTETFSDFKKIAPDLSFAQAVELLEKSETANLEHHPASGLAEKK